MGIMNSRKCFERVTFFRIFSVETRGTIKTKQETHLFRFSTFNQSVSQTIVAKKNTAGLLDENDETIILLVNFLGDNKIDAH